MFMANLPQSNRFALLSVEIIVIIHKSEHLDDCLTFLNSFLKVYYIMHHHHDLISLFYRPMDINISILI